MFLDTHVLLWLLDDSPRLGAQAREGLQRSTRVCVSAASLWELAIKADLGKVTVPEDLVALTAATGVDLLGVSPAAAWATRQVRLPHRDPFDRLLVAQARLEGLPLMTADRILWAEQPCELVDARL